MIVKHFGTWDDGTVEIVVTEKDGACRLGLAEHHFGQGDRTERIRFTGTRTAYAAFLDDLRATEGVASPITLEERKGD